jgi:acetyl-CoA carboxylase biotin carboxyl carrier protein
MFPHPPERPMGQTAQASGSRMQAASPEVHVAEAEISGDNVLSPMLGVFYSSPSPESEPFVKTGSKVKKGDVLCIIEAMKLMNEITAEKDGEITQVLAQNGQIVEFEQVIFKLL